MSAVPVLDVGEASVELSAAGPDGRRIETLSTPNPVLPGPPYPHHDRIANWIPDGVRAPGGVLVDHEGRAVPVRLDLGRPDPIGHPALVACAAAWRARARAGRHG